MKNKKKFLIWSEYLFAVGLFIILLTQIGIDDINVLLNRIRYLWYIPCVITVILFYWFKAQKTSLLFEQPYPIKLIFSIVTLQNIGNLMIPARGGEFLYVIYLKQKFNIRLSEGIGQVIYNRFTDIVCLPLFYLTIILTASNYPRALISTAYIISGIYIVFVFVVLLVLYEWRFIYKILFDRIRILQMIKNKYKDNIEKISMYIFDFEIYAKSKNLKKIILISTMSWICLFVYMYTVFQMLQIPASLSMVTFLTLLMSFVYLIPVNVLGGLGIVDVTWVGLLILCGIGRNDAIQSAIALRMVSYLNSLLLVCISFIILRWTENNV